MSQTSETKNGVIGIIILIAVAILAIAGIGYYLITSGKSNTPLIPMYVNKGDDTMQGTLDSSTPTPSVAPVSDSTDMKVMEAELNNTTVNSVDADFKSMNDSASSL